ncbi:PQQ-dependent sugar dehydrogenase [Gelidibacter sp. F63206]|uniref:PQQ-dependent sugar dehydrogenase n=1 Tax=Gelidibacter sp. F63206 TaxID=2926425 RepID=UPI001FF0EF7F|nr:PQQ-dependent sugar dehydrogenase [Gelidibacter sp. F63206]MCK0115218.1 PQQ-dependent sugar dehydrogenase [Gelidibacter sp. F63206]
MNRVFFFIALVCSAQSYAQEIELELFATGVSNTVNIQHAGDSRLFVLDRDGLIQIVNENGILNNQPFLNINDKVSDGKDERGLLGLAFHPNYASNGYFYVNYVNNSLETIISRFSRSNSNIQLADPNSELILMKIPQPYTNHNGGEIVFDNNGFLLIALGDGGDSGDPQDRSQNLGTFLGKLLRIDVNNPQNGNNYGIPNNNPYVDNPNALNEIWASGLRNPWKFSIDKTTNDIWIADVGQLKFEEINKASASEAGLNYGWRCYEGNNTYNTSNCPDVNTLTFPIAEYSHDNSGRFKCSITGGYRYRGTAQPSLRGIYFFADYCSSEIGMLKEDNGNWSMSFTEPFSGNNWTTFGEDVNGELYIGDISSGSIYKIKDATMGIEETALSHIKLYPNPVNDELTIDFGTANTQISEVYVYNIQGQQIKTLITFDNNSSKISTKSMAKGMYIMEILNDAGQKTTRKFVKN